MEGNQIRVAYCSTVARHTTQAGLTESCAPECHGRSSATAAVQCMRTILLVIRTLHITQAYTLTVQSLKSSLETFTCLLLHSALLTALSSDFDFFVGADNLRSELHQCHYSGYLINKSYRSVLAPGKQIVKKRLCLNTHTWSFSHSL